MTGYDFNSHQPSLNFTHNGFPTRQKRSHFISKKVCCGFRFSATIDIWPWNEGLRKKTNKRPTLAAVGTSEYTVHATNFLCWSINMKVLAGERVTAPKSFTTFSDLLSFQNRFSIQETVSCSVLYIAHLQGLQMLKRTGKFWSHTYSFL